MGDWHAEQDEAGRVPFPQACFDHNYEEDAGEVFESPQPTRSTVFDQLLELLVSEKETFSGEDLLHLVLAALGDRVSVNDGPEYIYTYARQQGYNIPPYPLAGFGEIKEFFGDYGVKNVPEWYGKIGISREAYKVLHEKNLIVVRNAAHKRKAFPIDSWRRLSDDNALKLATDILAFACGGEQDTVEDTTVF